MLLAPTDTALGQHEGRHFLGSSVSYRIAVGPQQGRKAFMIRTIRPLDRPDAGLERVANANGFSPHAGVSCEGHQKEKVRAGTAREAALVPKPRVNGTGTPSPATTASWLWAAIRQITAGAGKSLRSNVARHLRRAQMRK